MPEPQTDPNLPEEKRGPIARLRGGIRWLHANKKRFFWWWITYQAVKGTLTLSLIWIPLLILWLRGN